MLFSPSRIGLSVFCKCETRARTLASDISISEASRTQSKVRITYAQVDESVVRIEQPSPFVGQTMMPPHVLPATPELTGYDAISAHVAQGSSHQLTCLVTRLGSCDAPSLVPAVVWSTTTCNCCFRSARVMSSLPIKPGKDEEVRIILFYSFHNYFK